MHFQATHHIAYGYNNPIMFGRSEWALLRKNISKGNGDVLLGDIYMWKNMAAVAEYYGAKTNISKDGLEPLEVLSSQSVNSCIYVVLDECCPLN